MVYICNNKKRKKEKNPHHKGKGTSQQREELTNPSLWEKWRHLSF